MVASERLGETVKWSANMSRSKARKDLNRHPGALAEETSKRRNSRLKRALTAAAAVVAITAVVVTAWLWWAARQELSSLKAAEAFLSESTAHVRPGERVFYRAAPPLSGPHDPVATAPGYYNEIQPLEKLVHALEHGNIVIYVERPDPAVLQILRKWADQYSGRWDGVIVTPYPGLKQSIILTAWQRKLHLEEFDIAAATAFIDKFRGRGPENPVR